MAGLCTAERVNESDNVPGPSSRTVALRVMLILFACGSFLASSASAQILERTPIVLLAADELPKELLKGANYRVKEAVTNDGLVNIYELETLYGPLKVEGTVFLIKRISELRALQQIEQLKGTDVYLNALQHAVTSPLKTAEELITDPAGAATDVTSGIGRFFSNVASSISGSTPGTNGPNQGNVLNYALGQASYKREFAYQFGVDPYTSYEPLQKGLNDVAWTATAGGLTVKAAVLAVPGAAGTAIGMANTAGSLKALVRDKTPNELARINQDKLWGMGVPDPLVQVFMRNTYYDLWEQTLLVGELAKMKGVKDRKIFIEAATAADEESMAVFQRAQAQLMGLYHDKTKSVERFVDADGVPLLLTNNGTIVGIFAFDHVAWTVRASMKEKAISTALQKMEGVRGKELLITGTVVPHARKVFEDRGWRVGDRIQERLVKKVEP
jgi:hypothetical protein